MFRPSRKDPVPSTSRPCIAGSAPASSARASVDGGSSEAPASARGSAGPHLESTPASEPVPLAVRSDPTAAAPKKFPVRSGVVVLHDLRIPGSGGSIDHVCVGPGGVTVVKAVSLRGKVRARGSKLSIGGRDRSDLIRDVRLEVAKVRAVLGGAGSGTVDIKAAISMATVDGLPVAAKSRGEGRSGRRPAACRRRRRQGTPRPAGRGRARRRGAPRETRHRQPIVDGSTDPRPGGTPAAHGLSGPRTAPVAGRFLY